MVHSAVLIYTTNWSTLSQGGSHSNHVEITLSFVLDSVLPYFNINDSIATYLNKSLI